MFAEQLNGFGTDTAFGRPATLWCKAEMLFENLDAFFNMPVTALLAARIGRIGRQFHIWPGLLRRMYIEQQWHDGMTE